MIELDIHKDSERLEREIEDIKSMPYNSEIVTAWLRNKKLRNKCKTSTLERQLRYIKKFNEFFKKDFRKVTQKEIEEIILKLQAGKIKKIVTKKNFSDRGIKNLKAEMKSFFDWLIHEYKLKLNVDFIDLTIKEQEIPALDMEAEVNKLVEMASTPQNKFVVRLLSDGGFRVEEFLNLAGADLTYDKELGCYMARIRISKTKPRTISLPLSNKEIEDYINFKGGKLEPDKFIVPLSYSSIRHIVRSLGRKVLNKSINAHTLRHTSCTYYANKLNHFQMCKRYGWAFNSSMAQRYIDRNGIGEKETAKIVRSDEVGELKLRVSRQDIENKILREKFESLKGEVKNFVIKELFKVAPKLKNPEQYEELPNQTGRYRFLRKKTK